LLLLKALSLTGTCTFPSATLREIEIAQNKKHLGGCHSHGKHFKVSIGECFFSKVRRVGGCAGEVITEEREREGDEKINHEESHDTINGDYSKNMNPLSLFDIVPLLLA